jgi:hypothetical protein
MLPHDVGLSVSVWKSKHHTIYTYHICIIYTYLLT